MAKTWYAHGVLQDARGEGLKNRSWIPVLAGGFWIFLALHRSGSPAVASRWSVGYAAFLALAGAVAVLATSLVYRRSASFRLDLDAISAALSRRHRLFLAVVVGGHAALVFAFLPPRIVFGADPILGTDYAHHFHDVATFVRTVAADRAGWSYDPAFCAGYPQGTLFDVDVKLLEVLTYLATRAHVPIHLAYNGFILAFFLAPPVLLWLAARAFGLTPGATRLFVLAGVLTWHGQPRLVQFNRGGMCSFVLVVYAALLVAGLLDRFLREGRSRDCAWLIVATSVTMGAHILAAQVLLPPLLGLYARAFRGLSWRRHALLWLSLGFALLANAWWIRPVIQFYEYRIDTHLSEPEPMSQVVLLFFNGGRPDLFLAIAGGWGFWAARERYPGFAVMGLVSLPAYFALAFLLEGVPFLRSLEPTRFVIPLALFGIAGLVVGLSSAGVGRFWRGLPARAAVPAAIAAAYFTTRLFFPISPFQGDFSSGREALAPLLDWLSARTTRDARVAFQDQSPGFLTAAKLNHYVPRDFIGGPFSRLNLQHNHANFTDARFLSVDAARLDEADLGRFADLYNVGWMIGSSELTCAALTRVGGGLLRPGPRFVIREGDMGIGGRRRSYPVCTFEIDRAPDWFLEGGGRVRAEPNRITVADATPGGVVLKFHWMSTLVVDPPLPIHRHPIAGDPIGFLRIDNGATTHFVVRNAFRAP